MKKVLYGVFMAFFAVMAMGSLQSCTDDLDTLEHRMAVNFQNLDGDLAALRAEVAKNKAECEANIADLQSQITANDGDIAKLQQDLTALAGEVEKRVTYEELQKDLDALQAALKEEVEEEIKAAVDVVNARVDLLDGRVSAIETKYETLNGNVTDLLVRVENNEKAIAAIQTELGNIQTSVAANTQKIAELTDEFVALQKQIDGIQDNLDELWQEIFGDQPGSLVNQISQMYNAVQSQIDDLSDSVDNLKTAVQALEDNMALLTSRIDELITNILIQATDSPVFGNFSLPLGIQSNMLFNWFFENKGMGYTFPNAAPEYAYNTAEILDGRVVVSAEDVATAIASKNSTYAVPEGYTDVNLGDLYLTINPVGHNVLNGKTFYLETSKGEEGRLPFTLDVKESDYELLFGYSRSVANGFYASEVVVPGDAASIGAAKINMDQELKEAGKAMLNERTKRSVLNFLQAVYDQVNSSFPRYAVRAEWADPNKGSRKLYSVLSNYDLSVATAKPLSYAFLDGKGTSRRLPIYGHFTNLWARVKEKALNIDLAQYLDKALNGVNFNIDLGTITLTAPSNINVSLEDASITVNIDPINVVATKRLVDGNGNIIEPGTIIGTATPEPVVVTDFSDMESAMTEAIESAMEQAFAESNEDIQRQFAEISANVNRQIEDIINQIIDNLKSSIDGKIESVVDEIDSDFGPWFKRLDKLIDIYNRVANKVNAFLAEPNEYLQPAMFYKTADDLGIVSQAKNDPTVFANAGGGAFVLYPSSYTAELIAPAYKKMIACVNVIDNATGNYVSNGRELAKAFNATSNSLGVVLDGSIYGISVPGSALKAGYTYEIMYQALDYSGLTSTRKFYIKVK